MAMPEAPSIAPAIGAVSPNPTIPCTKARRDSRPSLTSSIKFRSSCSFIGWLQNGTLTTARVAARLPGAGEAWKVDQLSRRLSKQIPGQLSAEAVSTTSPLPRRPGEDQAHDPRRQPRYASLSSVMPGLVPGIHVVDASGETWMAGTRPAMTRVAGDFPSLRPCVMDWLTTARDRPLACPYRLCCFIRAKRTLLPSGRRVATKPAARQASR